MIPETNTRVSVLCSTAFITSCSRSGEVSMTMTV
ncbi:Uncharacterised protein [Mycobacterium tuberculosis]|nr:Uncharacterised protein [Mycobacterium tuberculosis]